MEKICSTCKNLKSINDFHKTKYGSDGYKTECKDCRKLYARKKSLEKGRRVRLDKSSETCDLKICTKCNFLQDRSLFNSNSWCLNCRRVYDQTKNNRTPKFNPIISETHKQCGECKEMIELSKFSPSVKGQLGLSSYCKPCSSKKQLKRKTKEERRVQTQKYRDNNREWWRSLHRINQYNRKNKIKLASDGTVSPDFVKKVYEQLICYYCKEEVPEKFRTLEHKLPLNKKGSHSAENIVMSCLSCNCSKGAMTEEEFIIYKNQNNE